MCKKKIYNIERESEFNEFLEILNNMDLKHRDLFNSPEYEKIRNLRITLKNADLVSGDYYFEKYYLLEKEVTLFKRGKCDINSDSREKLTYEDLYKEIYEEHRIDCGKLAYDSRGELYETGIDEDEDEDEKNIKCMRIQFDRTATGIKDNLEKILKVKGGDYKTTEHYEYLKLLKLIYVSREIYNKNIFELLKRPSMENTGHEVVVYDKETSDILFYIKNQVMKELTSEEIKEIRYSIEYVVNTFNKTCINRLYKILNDVVVLKPRDWHYYHDSIVKEQLRNILDTLASLKSHLILPQIENKNALFKKVFFKLLQKEKIGIQDDLIRLYKSDLLKSKPLEGKYQNIFLRLDKNKTLVNVNNIDNFISDNIKEIARIVYLKEEVSEKEEAGLLKCVKYCKEILREFILQTGTYFDYGVPIAMIVATLQTYHRAKTEELKVKYSYYHFDDKGKSITAVLKHADKMNIFQSLILTAMLQSQFFVNMGWKESYKLLSESRIIILNICKNILEIENGREMKDFSEEIYKNIFNIISWQYDFKDSNRKQVDLPWIKNK